MSTEFCPYCGAWSGGTLFCSYCGEMAGSSEGRIGASSEGEYFEGASAQNRGKKRGKIPRLYRSRSNRMLGGVCGGIGEILGIDATFIRIAFVLLTIIAFGTGVLFYGAMWMIIPAEKTAPEAGPGRNRVGLVILALVAISLGVAAISVDVLPWIWIGVGVGLIARSMRSRRGGDSPLQTSVPPVDIDWDAEAEAAWCRRFNMAMARKRDPTRIYPATTICPYCGGVTKRGPFCGHCGAKLKVSR